MASGAEAGAQSVVAANAVEQGAAALGDEGERRGSHTAAGRSLVTVGDGPRSGRGNLGVTREAHGATRCAALKFSL